MPQASQPLPAAEFQQQKNSSQREHIEKEIFWCRTTINKQLAERQQYRNH